MKRNNRNRNITGRHNGIYSKFKSRDEDLYVKRRKNRASETKILLKYWDVDWLFEPRVIKQAYDKMIEYRLITALDIDGREWEANWYAEWNDDGVRMPWIYTAEGLQNLQWEKTNYRFKLTQQQ
jgi:hypothetical protein